jgi:hypothetical protein
MRKSVSFCKLDDSSKDTRVTPSLPQRGRQPKECSPLTPVSIYSFISEKIPFPGFAARTNFIVISPESGDSHLPRRASERP